MKYDESPTVSRETYLIVIEKNGNIKIATKKTAT